MATGKKFYVETDPRESAVQELLPGNNCGACGYVGCDAVAVADSSKCAGCGKFAEKCPTHAVGLTK